MEIWLNEVCDMEAVLCSKKRTDDYLWVINEVHVRGHLEVSQNTLNVSREGVLSKSNE